MNREETKELLPIIEAFANGAEIEVEHYQNSWQTINNPTFTSGPKKYRIKPKPREFNICPSGCMIQQISGETQWTGNDAEWIKVREVIE